MAYPERALDPARPVHLVVVPHTHWDREWYQPFQEFRMRLVRLMDRLLEILERDPAFAHFHLDGQTIVLEDYLEIRPERRARLRKLVRAGRLAVGPWYVLPDEFLVSGEALIRNLQIGHDLAGEFGSVTPIGYLPDEFGHTAQMPQILAGFGIDSAVVWRGVGREVRETLFSWEGLDGSAAFTVYLPLSGYSNGRNLLDRPEALREQLQAIIAEQAPFRRIPTLLVLNGTDHQEPLATLPTVLSAATRELDGVAAEIAPLGHFIERARGEHEALYTHRGELRSPRRTNVIPGVTSARVRLKQRDFRIGSRLERYAEPLATWVDLLAGEPQLGPFLAWAWKILVQNHPHDSITGCSVDQVHRDMESRFDQVELVVEQVLSQAMTAMVDQLDTAAVAPDPVVAVYNPTAAGPGVVSAELVLDGAASYVLVDDAGQEVPLHTEARASEVLLDAVLPPAEVRPHVLAIQEREFLGLSINELSLERSGSRLRVSAVLDRMPRGRLDVAARRREWLAHLDDPALEEVAVRASTGTPARSTWCAPTLNGHGWTLFRLRRADAPAALPFRSDAGAIENGFYRVAVNDDGSLHVTDKQSGLVMPRCNWFVDEGDRGDEYNFDPLDGQAVLAPAAPPAIAIDAGNAVVATLTVTLVYELPRRLDDDRETRSAERVRVPIVTRVHLYAGVKRIDIETTVDNTAADHRLRVHVQTPLTVDRGRIEQAFGSVERDLDLEPPSPFEQPIGAGPQKTFTCVEADGHGVAVFNRGVPEVEVRRIEDGSEIALTLIRAIGWLSRGDLRFRHGPAGPGLETPDAQSPGPHRFEYALTTYSDDWRAAGVVAQAHAYAFPPLAAVTDAHAGQVPADASLVRCDNPHVVISAAAASKRADSFVTRWYNSSAVPQRAVLTVPDAARLRAVDFLERPRRGTSLRRVAPQRWQLTLQPFEIVCLQATWSAARQRRSG